jgi:hypothetical protein
MAPSRKSATTIIAACGLLLLCASFMAELVHGELVPALYVLGDSQADAGNNNHLVLSPLRANFPRNGIDYPGQQATGRFSNGLNFVDFLGAYCVVAYTSICMLVLLDIQRLHICIIASVFADDTSTPVSEKSGDDEEIRLLLNLYGGI